MYSKVETQNLILCHTIPGKLQGSSAISFIPLGPNSPKYYAGDAGGGGRGDIQKFYNVKQVQNLRFLPQYLKRYSQTKTTKISGDHNKQKLYTMTNLFICKRGFKEKE